MVELTLLLGRSGRRLGVAVFEEPGRPALAEARVSDFDERFWEQVDALESKRLGWEGILALGRQVGSVLVPGRVRSVLREALARSGGGGVRIRLVLDDPGLTAVPWEFAYVAGLHPELAIGPYLVLDPQISLVRHLGEHAAHAIGRTCAPADHVTVIVAPATRLRGLPQLGGAEPGVIESVLLGSGHTCVQLDDPTTLRDLRTALHGSADIVHFNGHADASGLLIGSETDPLAPFSLAGAQLADLLEASNVQLVVLNACETAAGGSRHDLARPLLAAGVPAVVAMQHAVEDSHAIAFARRMYSSLVSGEPIDRAVAKGRMAMCELGVMSEWGVPVLYTRDVDAGALSLVRQQPDGTRQAGASSVGRQLRYRLPTTSPDLIVRESELEALGADLTDVPDRVRFQALTGLPGVGKSQLAAEYVRRRQHLFDIVAWIRFEDGDVSDVASLANALELPTHGRSLQECADDLLVFLGNAGLTWLLVLDNLSHPSHLRAFPRTGRGEILATSRHRGGYESFGSEIPVRELSLEEATDFMIRRSGRSIEVVDARRVAAALGCLPLALSHAASACGADGFAFFEYLELLDNLPAGIMFDVNRETFYEQTVAATWLPSIRQAERDAPYADRLLRVASYMAADHIPRPVLASGTTAEERFRFGEALQALHRYSLVDVDGSDVRVHRLLQKVVSDSMGDEGSPYVNEAIARLLRQMPAEVVDPATWPEWQQLVPHALELVRHAHLPGVDDDGLVQLLGASAGYGLASGSPRIAMPLCEAHFDVASKLLGPEDSRTVAARVTRARAWLEAGHSELATAECADLGAMLPPHDKSSWLARQVLVQALEMSRRSAEAIEIGQGLVADLERHGAEVSLRMSAARSLAASLLSVGLAAAAIHTLERSLPLNAAREADEIEAVLSLDLLTSAHRAAGRIAAALEVGEQLASALGDRLGADHTLTLSARFNLASTYRSAGRIAEAIAIETDVFDRRTRLLGEHHTDTVWAKSNLGLSYLAAGETGRAIELFESVVETRRSVNGDEHSTTFTSLANLAIAYRAAGRYRDALVIQQSVLEGRLRLLGPDHFSTLSVRDHLSITFRRIGQFDRSLEMARGVVADRTRLLGPDHPATLMAMDNLAAACRCSDAAAAAVQVGWEALGIAERTIGPTHPDTVWTRINLARSLAATGDTIAALEQASQARSVAAEILGTSHSYVMLAADVLKAIPDDEVGSIVECERILWE